MNTAELLAPLDRLDQIGFRIVVYHLALDNPALFQQILDRVPIDNGGRWDKAAYDARVAAKRAASDG